MLDPELQANAEAVAAAREAAAIGGYVPHGDGIDPAQWPVVEAGGGVAEGFEEAERELTENAQHGDGGADPSVDGFSVLWESARSGAAYGDADTTRPAQ
jgi:hypothetical protein